jgi:predicted Zn finger-like uncharacterized protein
MLTQCPNCRTLFRVKPEQLEIADGKVRCSQCNQVFNALIRLQKSSDESQSLQQEEATDLYSAEDESTAPAWEEQQNGDTESQERVAFMPAEDSESDSAAIDDSQIDEDGETTSAPTLEEMSPDKAQDSEIIFEQDDGLEPAPDYLDVGTESQMSELLDQDTEASLLMDSDPPAQPAEVIDFILKETPDSEQADEPEEPLTSGFDASESILKDEILDIEEGKLDYDSIPAFREPLESLEPETEPQSDDKALSFEADGQQSVKRKGSKYWALGAILLTLLLSGQLTWQFRQELIQYEAGRQVLGLFCKVVGCEMPTRRDTNKIVIQGRNLSSDPNNPDILVMQLSMVNTAPYEQPYPKLQLSLFDDNGKLVARRIFTAEEYLPNKENISMMPRATSILAEMQVVDPGEEVTGFSFDFL